MLVAVRSPGVRMGLSRPVSMAAGSTLGAGHMRLESFQHPPDPAAGRDLTHPRSPDIPVIVLQVNGYVPIRLGFLDVGDGVAAPVTPRENGVMENVGDRPRRVELVW